MFDKKSDPIRCALEEILAQAKRYQSEPLMEKLKAKQKPTALIIEEEPDDEISSLKGRIDSDSDEDKEPEMDEETKEKLRKLLGV